MIQHTKVQHEIQSSVSKVECYVCGKGLAEGHSVSAKTLANGIVLQRILNNRIPEPGFLKI